ncbi:MAG: hypothetical protein ACO258_04135 [Burkholderiaceae bacterium]
MLNWAYFPRSAKPVPLAISVVQAFHGCFDTIDSARHTLKSNEVLTEVRPALEAAGFRVERGSGSSEQIHVPVLYGNNGTVAKALEADAFHAAGRFVVEVEAGRAVVNNQFLKDLFQACMMDEVDYLGIAVRNAYSAGGGTSQDFSRVVTFFDTLYASSRLTLPLKGIVIIVY